MALDGCSGLSDIYWLLSSAIERIRVLKIYIVTTDLTCFLRNGVERNRTRSLQWQKGLVGSGYRFVPRSRLRGWLLIVLDFCNDQKQTMYSPGSSNISSWSASYGLTAKRYTSMDNWTFRVSVLCHHWQTKYINTVQYNQCHEAFLSPRNTLCDEPGRLNGNEGFGEGITLATVLGVWLDLTP